GQHTAGTASGFVGEARCGVHRAANDGVLVALLGADVAGDDVAAGDADPGIGDGLERFAQCARGAQCASRVIWLLGGRAENTQRTVALELVHPSALGTDRAYDRREETVEE